MLLPLEAMNFLYIYTENLIGNITRSKVIIFVASVNQFTKHTKRYETVASHSFYGVA